MISAKFSKIVMPIVLVFVLVIPAFAQVEVESITLNYVIPKGSTDQRTYEPFMSIFEQVYPHIKVNYEKRPGVNWIATLLTEFAGGDTTIDVFQEWPRDEVMVVQGHVIPLDGSYDPEIKISGELMSQFFPSLVELWSYPRTPMLGLKPTMFGMPLNNSDAFLLVYREDLVSEAGFGGPPGTWAERIEMGIKMTKDLDGDGNIDIWGDTYHATMVGGGAEPVDEFFSNLLLCGGRYVDDESMPVWNSDQGVEALEYMLTRLGKSVPPEVTTLSMSDNFNLMNAGKVAMAETAFGYWAWLDTIGRPQSGKVFIAPYPPKEGYKSTSYTHGGGARITTYSKNKKEAWLLLQFLVSEQIQGLVQRIHVDVSALTTIYDDPIIEATFDARFRRAIRTYAPISMNAHPLPVFPGGNKVMQVLGEQIERTLLGKISPKDALDKAAAEAKKIIEKELAKTMK